MMVTLGSRSQTKNFYVNFALKILDHYLVAFRQIYWRLGMVKDIALKFLSATSAPVMMTLGSRSQT